MKQNILKKISYYAKKGYRSARSKLFVSIYGKISLSKNPPNCSFKKIKNVNKLRIKNYLRLKMVEFLQTILKM